ncbi:transcription factor PIF1-like [Cynara cardunculus var. scolymus]|uniref:transcription factor PIF1-like n=1 Tax=Cynara cardunculus var. scolymus TaxID=59895 RepID=UPI000D628C88|nr:transcription factor PIF1-like [Cynara cardunculus var. scolymus]
MRLAAILTWSRFDVGQSSGSKRKADDIEGNIEKERELKSKQQHDGRQPGTQRVERELNSKQQHDSRQPGSQRVATQINATEKRRRDRITDRIFALRELVPNCNKVGPWCLGEPSNLIYSILLCFWCISLISSPFFSFFILNVMCLQRDKVSILGDAVDYIKFLQMQIQMTQHMGVGSMSQGLYMSQTRQPCLQVPNLAPHHFMRPMIGMQYGVPQFGSYVPTNIPTFPPFFSGFPPLVPPVYPGTGSLPWGQTRPLIPPQELRFPSQASQSTIPFSDTIIPTTFSQAGSTDVLGQPLYHVPVTSQDPGFTSWSLISVYDTSTSLNRAHGRFTCRSASKYARS